MNLSGAQVQARAAQGRLTVMGVGHSLLAVLFVGLAAFGMVTPSRHTFGIPMVIAGCGAVLGELVVVAAIARARAGLGVGRESPDGPGAAVRLANIGFLLLVATAAACATAGVVLAFNSNDLIARLALTLGAAGPVVMAVIYSDIAKKFIVASSGFHKELPPP